MLTPRGIQAIHCLFILFILAGEYNFALLCELTLNAVEQSPHFVYNYKMQGNVYTFKYMYDNIAPKENTEQDIVMSKSNFLLSLLKM